MRAGLIKMHYGWRGTRNCEYSCRKTSTRFKTLYTLKQQNDTIFDALINACMRQRELEFSRLHTCARLQTVARWNPAMNNASGFARPMLMPR